MTHAGVRGGRFGTSCAFGDFDGDGRLDLYVANYVDVDIEHLPAPGSSRFCTLFVPVFETYTLPASSTAIPFGVFNAPPLFQLRTIAPV